MGEHSKAPTIVMIVGGVFALLITILGFGGEDKHVPVGVPFGMQFNPLGGPELKVWARTPLPAYIQVILSNISKVDDDGSVRTGVDIFELFPSGDAASVGGARANFTLELIKESDEPPLNSTMDMIPMVWRREPKVGRLEHVIYFVAAFSLTNWAWLSWAIIGKGLVLIVIGGVMFMQERKSESSDMVEVMVAPEEET